MAAGPNINIMVAYLSRFVVDVDGNLIDRFQAVAQGPIVGVYQEFSEICPDLSRLLFSDENFGQQK